MSALFVLKININKPDVGWMDGCGHEKLKRESLRILKNDSGFLLREVCGLLRRRARDRVGVACAVIDA